MSTPPLVTELRLVVTADDHDAAVAFHRDALGLTELESCTERGAGLIAVPTRTPWDSLNSRLDAPADLQLTLFTDL